MTFEEKLDRLDGIFAMDNGAASSGIRDDKFKEEMKTDSDLEKLLLHLTRRYMNDDRYTFEDLFILVKWTESELDFEV